MAKRKAKTKNPICYKCGLPIRGEEMMSNPDRPGDYSHVNACPMPGETSHKHTWTTYCGQSSDGPYTVKRCDCGKRQKRIYGNASPKGPLESLTLKGYCEMCGAFYSGVEAAFDSSGKPKTLCKPCRTGSAELLHDKAQAMRIAAQAVIANWESGNLADAVNGLRRALEQ
jgi:hypothetical protein